MQRKQRGGLKRLTIEEMCAIAAARGGRCLSTEYVNNHMPLEWECAKGHRWWAKAANVKFGKWCGICVRNQRATVADMQRLAQERGGRCLSETWTSNRTAMEWECARGHRWLAPPANVKRGQWCRACANDRKRVPLAHIQAAAEAKGGRCLSPHHVNAETPLEFECAAGHRWWTLPLNVTKGHWCQRCQFAMRRKSMEDIRALATQRGGQCVSETYTGKGERLRWRCASGHEWEATFTDVSHDRWCPRCREERRRAAALERLREFAATRGGQCLSAAYVSTDHKLEWMCSRGHVWSTRPSSVLDGSWCPLCAYLGRSKKPNKRLKYDFEG